MSAFRFATFVFELTVRGGFPAATLSPSAVALAPPELLVSWSSLSLTLPVTLVLAAAVLLASRLKTCTAASAVVAAATVAPTTAPTTIPFNEMPCMWILLVR